MDYPNALILTPPRDDEWTAGQGKATAKYGGDLNPIGDWTKFIPRNELQARFNFETMACTVFATYKAWIALAKFFGFSDFPSDASERYGGIATGVTTSGNDPHLVAEITRTIAGMIPQEVLPWTDDLDSWDEFYSPKAMSPSFGVFRSFGRALLDKFELGQQWIFAYGTRLTPAEKHAKLKEYLKRGTVCVSVEAWQTKSGSYWKQAGASDNHWTWLIRFDGDHPIVHDQYDPFIKRLAKDYDFNAAKVYFLKRKEPTADNFFTRLWDNFAKLWRGF